MNNNKHIGILWWLLLVVGIANAQVGINTTDPKRDLDVNGDVRIQELKKVYVDELFPEEPCTPTVVGGFIDAYNLTITPTVSYTGSGSVNDKYVNVLVQSSNTGFVDKVPLQELLYTNVIKRASFASSVPVGGFPDNIMNLEENLEGFVMGIQSVNTDVVLTSSGRKNGLSLFFKMDPTKMQNTTNTSPIAIRFFYYENYTGLSFTLPSEEKYIIKPGEYTAGSSRNLFQNARKIELSEDRPFFCYGYIIFQENLETYGFVLSFNFDRKIFDSLRREDEYFGRVLGYFHKY